MMQSISFLVLVACLFANVAQAKVPRGSNIEADPLETRRRTKHNDKEGSSGKGKGKGKGVTLTDIEANFFVEFIATDVNLSDEELVAVADCFVETYNSLLDSTDEFERKMTAAEVVSVEPLGYQRKLTDQSSRKLQFAAVLLNLNVDGNCKGCFRQLRFTNQAAGRRRHLEDEGVPTEAEFLDAFSANVQGGCSDILESLIDAVWLEEDGYSKTSSPTTSPTSQPTKSPTKFPTDSPSVRPSRSPSSSPTISPSKAPTFSPTDSPSSNPTKGKGKGKGSTSSKTGGGKRKRY